MRGVDFRIKKTSKGGYADYSTSQWSRRERSLTEEEAAAIEANGLFNLSDFLPKRPGEVEMQVMKEMFEASVDGEPYDASRWSQYFRPAGMSQATGDPNKTSVAVPQAPSTPSTPEATVETPSQQEPETASPPQEHAENNSEGSSRAQDILAQIRARKSAE